MGWDTYCAICGGTFRKPTWDIAEEEEEESEGSDYETYGYDPAVLPNDQDPELNWLQDARLIGENPTTSAPCSIWVSGPAREDDFGLFYYELGNIPDPALLDIEPPEASATYNQCDDWPSSVPFHHPCRELLCHYMGISEVDKTVLHAVFMKLSEDEGSRRLDIDYHDVSGYQEQDWEAVRGGEYSVFNPVDVKGLKQAYESFALLSPGDTKEATVYRTEGDPFTKLSPDILFHIMSQFSHMGPVLELRKASPAFANIRLGNGFWKKRLDDDMPWLWDMPKFTSERVEAVDWKLVYRRMDLASQHSLKKKDKIHGLCNRRRIWEQMCPQFLDSFTEFNANLLAWGSTEPPVLKDAYESTPRTLRGTDERSWKPTTETLFDMSHELATANPTIMVDWTTEGHLVDLHVLKESNRHETTAKERRDIVHIPENDWLTGFIITTREIDSEGENRERHIVGFNILFAKQLPVQLGSTDGDKRLFYVKEGNFIVALRTYRSEDGVLEKVGLVEQPLSFAESSLRVSDTLRDNYSVSTMKYSWLRELPSSHLRLSKPVRKRGRLDDVIDASPMDILVLGTSEEELADITAISVDICLGGIEVVYGHHPIRKIGTRFQAMKTLSIDGQGGERVVSACATSSSFSNEPGSLTILTNRGRCLAIGLSPVNFDEMEVSDNLSKLALCGFYGLWMSTGSGPNETWLMSIGTVGSVNLGYIDSETLPAVPKDSNKLTWEPSMLLPNLKESGPVWGSRADASLLLPMARVVSKIDCSRALKEVRVTITHSSSAPVMAPITAITFEYTDGGEESVGPGKFPEDATCTGCKHAGIEGERNRVPHYRHETWKVGGKKLTSLKIWRHSCMSIGAIQFVADGHMESPVCGYWGHDTNELEFSEMRFAGEGGGTAVALKMFLGKVVRGGYRDDDVIVGIQELVSRDSYTVEVRPRD